MFNYCLHSLSRGIDINFFINTLFENYYKFRTAESNFYIIPEILDQFAAFDNLKCLERRK